MYDPAYREEYIEYLEDIGQHTEAAKQLAICIDDDNYASPKGRRTDRKVPTQMVPILYKIMPLDL